MLDIQGLHVRAALFRCIRDFFTSLGFLEVDTPIRQPVLIPESNIEPLMSEGFYLQTSPELCMKRLLARGSGNIFQICHVFRKNERGRRHLEEFAMLEWYRMDSDYLTLMEDCTALLKYILDYEFHLPDQRAGSRIVRFSEFTCLQFPPERLTVQDAFARYAPITLAEAMATDTFEEILVEFVEPNLGFGNPQFLMDYPLELASLARVSEKNPAVAERFELYIDGVELANGFSELTDADEQRARFRHEIEVIEERSGNRQELPEKFLDELSLIHDAAGIALGLDRLQMLLTGQGSINDVVPFSPLDM